MAHNISALQGKNIKLLLIIIKLIKKIRKCDVTHFLLYSTVVLHGVRHLNAK
jgi:hypothetical protein